MTYINITKFVLINSLEKDHSMIETRRLKNVVVFIQTILSFVLSRKKYMYTFLYLFLPYFLSTIFSSLHNSLYFFRACFSNLSFLFF